jgi:hypothetical protein
MVRGGWWVVGGKKSGKLVDFCREPPTFWSELATFWSKTENFLAETTNFLVRTVVHSATVLWLATT